MVSRADLSLPLMHVNAPGEPFLDEEGGSSLEVNVSGSDDGEGDVVGRRRRRILEPVTFREQLQILNNKRWEGQVTVNYLEQMWNEGGIEMEDLSLDLMPAIRNQTRANKSVLFLVRRLATSRARRSTQERRRIDGNVYRVNVHGGERRAMHRLDFPSMPPFHLPPPPPPPVPMAPVMVNVEVDVVEEEETQV